MSEVDHPGKLRPWFRRRWFRILLFLLASPLLLLALSNAWLALPWGRCWVESGISSRLGHDARIAGATWSPWNGVRVAGLVIHQPEALRSDSEEPLFSAASIRIWPVWAAWLRMRLEVHSIEVDSPRLVIPVQLLAKLAGPSRIAVAPPPIAAAGRPPAQDAIPPLLQAPAPPVAPTTGDPPPVSQVAIAQSHPTGWIHVRNASLSIVSVGRAGSLLEASGFTADIPASGDPADSSAQLTSVRILHHELTGPLQVPLHWQSPCLQIGPCNGMLNDVPYRLSARMARLGNLPLEILLEAPVKSDAIVSLPGGGTARASQLRAAARFAGLLTSPSSWQGDFVIEATGLVVLSPPRPELRFDQAGAFIVLRGGLLSCTDARLIGDQLSLLGNATVLSDSRCAAAMRIVVPPEDARGMTERIGRDIGKRITFGMMGTPDRVVSDLQALGNLDGIRIQLGQGGDVIDGPTLIALLKAKTTASQ